MDESENGPIVPHSNGGKLLAGFVALTVVVGTVIVACGIAHYVGSHARYRVVGAVDSASGSRIEYTISTHFHKSADIEMGNTRDLVEAWDYRPQAPAKAIQWIYKHILRKPLPARGSIESDPLYSIMQFSFKGTAPPGSRVDSDGYIHLDTRGLGVISKSEERTHISGYPATWYAFSLPDSFGAHNIVRYYCLLIRPQDRPIVYAIVGVDDKENSMGIPGEMLKIRESVRIVSSRGQARGE